VDHYSVSRFIVLALVEPSIIHGFAIFSLRLSETTQTLDPLTHPLFVSLPESGLTSRCRSGATRRSRAIHVLAHESSCSPAHPDVSSPVSFARAPLRELFATRADYCHLLAFGEHRAASHCRLDRMSPRSFLGNLVTFLLTPLPCYLGFSYLRAARAGCSTLNA